MIAYNRHTLVMILLCLFICDVFASRWKRVPRKDQIFEYGKTSLYYWNTRGMYLEDLYSKYDPVPQYHLNELGLSYSINNHTNITPEQMYYYAVKNLKQAAPNLRTLWLIGGYHFNPYYKTYQSLYNEISYLLENLRALTKQLQNSKFYIYSHSREVKNNMNSIRFIMFSHMTKRFIESQEHIRIIKELLGHQATPREIYDRYFIVIKEMNGIRVYIELGFFTNEDPKQPLGRTRFVETQVENLIID